jgi:tetratricopeptide (TPR) repeat protein
MTHFLDILLTIVVTLVLVGAACVGGYRSLKRSEDPPKLAFKWIFTAVLVGGTLVALRGFPQQYWASVVLIPAFILGLVWAPNVGALVARPLTGLFDGGDEEVERRPLYSMAEAKRSKGLYQEAAQEVRCQLEKFPWDLTGTLLLGAILAENLNDLPGARQLIFQWVNRPNVPPQGVAAMLKSLADWELQIGRDPEAARACLERIAHDYAGTPLAHQAQQRIAHLPDPQYVLQRAENENVDLPPGEKDIGLRAGSAGNAPAGDSDNPEALAQSCVEQLRRHPTDIETREKLALLYGEHFQRLDLAADQLEQLISLPGETPKHIARWLNLLATLQVRIGADVPAAERTLRRILDRFPDSAAATQAFERLASLNQELRATEKTAVKTLGKYEKHLGLKPGKG